jgi:hypothetical protein
VIAGQLPLGGGGGSLRNNVRNSGSHGGAAFYLHAGPATPYPS